MNTVLFFSANGTAYETRAYSAADVDELVRARGLQCLTSADRQFDFWFSPSPQGCQQSVNRHATELLLATTRLTAKTVPLLRGAVVISTHDSDGDLDGLSWAQLDLLVKRHLSVTPREERVLSRRIARDTRRRRRSAARGARASATARSTTLASAPH